MATQFLLWSLQLVAVSANTNFGDALKFHQKRQTPAQAESACGIVLDVLTACNSISPGFRSMAASRQAPCACYYADATTTAWVPNLFDNAVATCGSYARTQEPAVYSGLLPFSRLCNRVGDLRTVNAVTTSRAPAPVTAPAACNTVLSALQYCNSANPGLSTKGISSSARCLCYSSSSWLPGFFDGAVQTCANFAKSASPTDYSVIAPLEGFCTSVGDVLKPANIPATTSRGNSQPTPVITPTTTPDITPSPTLTGIATFPACSAVGQAIFNCESLTPGFTTIPASSQAACICYTRSTSWIPQSFDNAASSCAGFVRTASPKDYTVFSNLAGFCSDVGDIYATPTGRITTSRTVAGGGIGAGGLIIGDSTSTEPVSPTRTTTVTPPGPAQPTSSRGLAVPTAAVGAWVKRVISLVVVVQVLA